ncbi:glycosyltransferase family 39 protein [Candidatus Collierbacteria bacterium]|nr:glycosyltransferase family 39 protein [Candidatus Collierbacteria bacterium]
MWKRRALAITALTILYLSSRLINLTLIPIFTDEAIYIRWGQIALQDPVHRFISLEDGKQPLFIWLMLPMLKWVSDPLIAGRLVSVFSGAITLAGLMALSWKLFGERTGWIAGLTYIISPFFLLYDRLALYDSLTTVLMIWALFLSVLLAETLRIDVALLLGMTVGAGFLTKSSAQFALILLPTTFLLFDWKERGKGKRLLKLAGLGIIVVLLSKGIELILRLAPLSHMIALKDHTFIVTTQEFIAHPFERLLGNMGGLWNWMQAYATYPLLALFAVGMAYGLKKYKRRTTFLSLWFLVPFLALASFGKVLYPRYLLFMIAPLLPIIALGISEIVSLVPELRTDALRERPRSAGRREVNPVWGFIITFLLISYPIWFSYKIIFDPLSAPLPKVDRFQFFDDWPSGYGINEVIGFIKVRAETQKIFVGTEGTFGLTPAALNIYLKDNPNVEVKGYWPISDGIKELTEIALTGKPTYVLFKDTQKPNPEWPLEFIVKYQKGRGEVYMSLYHINSKK